MFSLIFLIFLLFVNSQAGKICQISVPIGEWLKNNTGPCTTVKGHFILDESANNFTAEIFASFGELRTIEGCLYVNRFNGSNNLSFFGALENVVCNQKKAAVWNLTNVIYVLGPYLKTMGFNSLKSVEGPGEIFISYEEKQIPYSSIYMVNPVVEGVQCYSIKEMLFLARHLQFNGKMYQPCEVTDRCFKLEHFQKDGRYTIADIPENCTVFVGSICIIGPYEYRPELFDKFMNLTMIIGQIHVAATLLDSMEDIFPNLRDMYPYEHTDNVGDLCDSPSTCDPTLIGGYTSMRTDAMQIVRVRLNRFMNKMALPSLQANRALDVSNPRLNFYIVRLFYYYPSIFPEPTQNPCSHYPQFKPENCGTFINSYPYPGENDSPPAAAAYDFHAWLVTVICTAIGVVFTTRAMILLQFSNATICLPYSRYFLLFSIFISILTTLESSFIYQQLHSITDGKRNVPEILSEFYSDYLLHPLAQFIMLFLVSSKYTCLVLLIFCYIDLVIFYRINKPRVSLVFLFISTIIAIILCVYLHSQLYITIRGRRPYYSREPRYVVYMPFIMNAEYAATFNNLVPLTSYIPWDYNNIDFTGNSDQEHRNFAFQPIPLDIHGYIQLSVNRIRYYIYDLLVNDFCLRKDVLLDVDIYEGPYYTCYTKMGRYLYQPPIMDEYLWRIIEKLLVGLPSITFLVTAVTCWIFARYESYLGPALQHREKRNDTKNVEMCNPEDLSDIPNTTRIIRKQ